MVLIKCRSWIIINKKAKDLTEEREQANDHIFRYFNQSKYAWKRHFMGEIIRNCLPLFVVSLPPALLRDYNSCQFDPSP